jgi:hypothetical protein
VSKNTGALAAPVGAGEQPCLPAQGHAAQGAFRGIVRQADAPVGQEPGERGPVLEHVVDRADDRVVTGERGAL